MVYNKLKFIQIIILFEYNDDYFPTTILLHDYLFIMPTLLFCIIHHNYYISLDIERLKNCRKGRPTSQLVVPIIKSAKYTRHCSAETTTIASVNNMACTCVLF